ncbi:hypothetical protein FACS18942_09900 [Planctomycetales bacterium]|nr:hypothetical protein FACS18942_09900 [Planctomycetales bacterium]
MKNPKDYRLITKEHFLELVDENERLFAENRRLRTAYERQKQNAETSALRLKRLTMSAVEVAIEQKTVK